jgi:hypothetical protein
MAFTNKNIALAVAALLACGSAAATEDYDLRYAPGIGGADMSAPFEGGWVFQLPIYTYSGNIRSTTVSNNDLSAALSLPAGYLTSSTNIRTNTYISVHGFLPRLSYMSSATFLGATIGGTVLLPLIQKGSGISVTGVSTTLGGAALSAVPTATQAGLIATVNNTATASAKALAAGNTNKSAGIGDLEFSPILRWSTEATQTLFVLTAVAPTGKYDKSLAANPSAGKFWTVRPAVQFSYIGDGWDVGTRVAYSWNSRNTETKYKSGSYTNVDLTAMKSVSESTRIGLSGYAVNQLTKDSTSLTDTQFAAQGAIIEARQESTLDQKGHVYGIGPEVAYIQGAGEFLLEGRIMKEFGADTRPKGFTAFLTLSKPF